MWDVFSFGFFIYLLTKSLWRYWLWLNRGWDLIETGQDH